MIRLSISTPEQITYDDEIYSLSIPGSLGYMEILPRHAPLITSLRAGKVTLTTKNRDKLFYTISGGLFEIADNRAFLLADSIENG